MARVFISYSHDSEAHRDRVYALARRLRADGQQVGIDEDAGPGGPPNGWELWSQHQVEDADRVIAVCTATYRARFDGREPPGAGLGAAFEAKIIRAYLYAHGQDNRRVRAVLLDAADARHVPATLLPYRRFAVDSDTGYAELLAWLRDAPPAAAPGVLVALRWVVAVRKAEALPAAGVDNSLHRWKAIRAARFGAPTIDWGRLDPADLAVLQLRPQQPVFDPLNLGPADDRPDTFSEQVAVAAKRVGLGPGARPDPSPIDCLPAQWRTLPADLRGIATALLVGEQRHRHAERNPTPQPARFSSRLRDLLPTAAGLPFPLRAPVEAVDPTDCTQFPDSLTRAMLAAADRESQLAGHYLSPTSASRVADALGIPLT